VNKFIYLIALASLTAMPVMAQQPKINQSPKFTIKPAIGEKVVKPEGVIRALCSFAKIDNFTIDKEITDDPGKFLSISSSNIEVLFNMVCKIFDIEISKVGFEDDSILYQFKKVQKKK
jgi:hypothetical protein